MRRTAESVCRAEALRRSAGQRSAAATLTPKPTPLTLGGGLVKTIEVYSTILGSG